MTQVVWLGFDDAVVRGRWDQTWVQELLPRGIDQPDGWGADVDSAVVVVCGEIDPDRLGPVLDRLESCVLIVTSNEERRFPHHRFAAPNRVLWLHTPDPDDLPTGWAAWRPLPTGWTPGTIERFAASCPAKDLDLVFAGQVNHERRRDVVTRLRWADGQAVAVEAFDHFTGDLAPDVYADMMRRARMVPCPAGNVSLDSFRVYEALQAGAVPILDSRTAQHTMTPEFWSLVFGADHPLPVTDEGWLSLNVAAAGNGDTLADPIEVAAWWTQFKRGWREAIDDDLATLGASPLSDHPFRQVVTAVVTASPIPSHPDIDVLDETVRSIIDSFAPAAVEIVVAFDGVRPEQQHRAADYREAIRRATWAANHRWPNTSIVVAPEWGHQANLLRLVLDGGHVTTPALLFVEHDTPLIGDIPWANALSAVSGEIDMLRFHYDDTIHPDHRYLLVDERPINVWGLPVYRTRQWSQRPHLAKTDWYRRLLDKHFPRSSRTMIEDKMHSVAQQGEWHRWRLAIYAPEGGMRRSGHIDGRRNDPKYEMRYA